ncbi:MAG: hypothetical protein K2X01_06405 [Cyanobacteria bacterium]|nr:hypothetical protein [Cyanobacteriota bacterium]
MTELVSPSPSQSNSLQTIVLEEPARTVLAEILEKLAVDRAGRPSAILIGGGCCDGLQAQLVDRGLINRFNDKHIGCIAIASSLTLDVFAATSAAYLDNAMLTLALLPLPADHSSDSVSLETRYGFQLQMQQSACLKS